MTCLAPLPRKRGFTRSSAPHRERRGPSTRTRGFTLVELVVTLVIASILSIATWTFVSDSVTAMLVTRDHNQLASGARTVIDRLSVELYNAVPNSIRVSSAGQGNQCLEFIPFTHATTYVDAPFSVPARELLVMQGPPGNPLPSGDLVDTYLALYPVASAALYDLDSGAGPIAAVDSVDADPDDAALARITLSNEHLFPGRSPLERVFLARQPVSFCVEGAILNRYSDYGFHPAQCPPLSECLAQGRKGPLANNLVNADLNAFTYTPDSLLRNGIVVFQFRFETKNLTVELRHDLLLRNVP